jgi:hypothetical protein
MPCYCFVSCFDENGNNNPVRCDGECDEGKDFCRRHIISFTNKSRNIRVSENTIELLAPSSKRVIMDDGRYRENTKYFNGWKFMLQPDTGYQWIFVYYMVKRIEQKIKRFENYTPAYKIQRAWRRCVSNPWYKVCKDRLLKEFCDSSELLAA